MDDVRRVEEGGRPPEERQGRRPATPPGGGAVYGLGFLGALVWFWRQADGFGEHVVGFLKAVVWPSFLVYEAFRALQR